VRRTAALALALLWAASPALAQQSTNYTMPSDAQGAGGGEEAKSTNYKLEDTIGEQSIGQSATANYELNAGYRQTIKTYISLSGPPTVAIGTITGNGQKTASGTWTVVTDADAGYTLSWAVRTGSGGVNTGALINEHEHLVRPFNLSGGLVGHWRLDETSTGGSDSVFDASGNGYHGTPTGPSGTNNKPQPSTAVPDNPNFKTNRSLDFDGTDDYVAANASTPFNFGTGDFSLSAWIRTTSSSTVVAIGNYNGGEDYWLGVNSGVATFSISGGSVAGGTVNDGNWHLITGVRSAGTIIIYVDGVQQNTAGNTNGASPAASPRIGAFSNGYYWPGQIDDARIYNRALSAAEVGTMNGTPQSWSIANTTSAWGARLRSSSTDTDAKWGTDGASAKWLNVGDGTYNVVTRNTRTSLSGSNEILQFRAEIGSNKIQTTGTYTATVIVTATSL